jgi:hypothetical protein
MLNYAGQSGTYESFVRVPFGETRSVWNDFNQLVLSIISRHPDFTQYAEDVILRVGHGFDRANFMEVINQNPCPWTVYGTDEAMRFVRLVGPPDDSMSDEKTKRKDGPLFRYSAASLAIRFLQSLHSDSQSQFRTITLLEDKASINNPPSHVQGLIPFCRRNPRLHIERALNLWTAGICFGMPFIQGVRATMITRSLGGWIIEALELRDRGMPDGSFRLTLDGDPIPDMASQISGAVKRDASRQAALDICFDRHILPLPRPSWFTREGRLRGNYQWKRLPEAIAKLQSGDYAWLISCNFDLGAPCDPERLISDREG